MSSGSEPKGRPRKTRGRRTITTAAELETRAQAYIERYAATRRRLQQVLTRAFPRTPEEGDRATLTTALGALLDRYEASGLLDDRRFAEARTASLRARGHSARGIRQKLAAQGVPSPLLSDERPADEGRADELEAARAYVRKRRLGCFRASEEERKARLSADLRSLARRGFSFPIARRALEVRPDDAVPEDEP